MQWHWQALRGFCSETRIAIDPSQTVCLSDYNESSSESLIFNADILQHIMQKKTQTIFLLEYVNHFFRLCSDMMHASYIPWNSSSLQKTSIISMQTLPGNDTSQWNKVICPGQRAWACVPMLVIVPHKNVHKFWGTLQQVLNDFSLLAVHLPSAYWRLVVVVCDALVEQLGLCHWLPSPLHRLDRKSKLCSVV